MTNLSPAAQAVLDHFLADAEISMGHGLAAALRAVADQDETLFDVEEEMVPAVRAVRTDRLFNIAAELEGADD